MLTRPTATLNDSVAIVDILDDLFIVVSGPLHSMEVIDITANGYGPNDVIILYPSAELYVLDASIPSRTREIMGGWELETDFRLDASAADSTLGTLPDEKAALAGGILETIDAHYTSAPIDLCLSRTEAGEIRIDMWNFDEASLRFAPSPACFTPESLEQEFRFRDMVYIESWRDAGDCVRTRVEGNVVTQWTCNEE